MRLYIIPKKTGDGITPHSVVGEVNLKLSPSSHTLHLDALVTNDLDVDFLAGTHFKVTNRGVYLQDVNVKDDVEMALKWRIHTWAQHATFHVVCDVHVLELNPSNDISIRLSKQQITIKSTDVTHYDTHVPNPEENRAVCRNQARTPPSSSSRFYRDLAW